MKSGLHLGFDGKLVRSGSWYAIAVPALLIHAQAKTQKEALVEVNEMTKVLLENAKVTGFNPKLTDWTNKRELTFRVHLPVSQPSIAFILRQVRGFKKLSLAKVARKMNHSSKNAIAAYEKIGGPTPSIEKLSQIFKAYEIPAVIAIQ